MRPTVRFPLPASRLTALRTPQGWCGRVDRPAGEVQPATPVIAEAYDLPPGSVAARGDDEHGAFPDDLVAAIDYPGGRELTIPIPTWPGAVQLARITGEDLTLPQ